MKRRTILTAVGVVAAVVVIAIVLHSGAGNGLGLIAAHAGSSYFGVAVLVFLDAVCPVFPGETTLNAASTLAAQGALSIWLVMLAGSVGAVVGDSALTGSRVCSRTDSPNRSSTPSRTRRSRARSGYSVTTPRCS